MKVFLMHQDRDFAREPPFAANAEDLAQDLEIDTLLDAMAEGDDFLREVAHRAMLSSLAKDVETIRYRQDVLRDCLEHPDVIRQLYDLSLESLERRRELYLWISSSHPSSTLSSAVRLLQAFNEILMKLVHVARTQASSFNSEGFRKLFAMIETELDDDHFRTATQQLDELKLANGILVSAELGDGNRGTAYTLRRLERGQWDWLTQMLGKTPSDGYTFHVQPRDDAGQQALSELSGRALAGVADTTAQAADHVQDFFAMLRTELAFYISCINLHTRLREKTLSTCFPKLADADARRLSFKKLADPGLALTLKDVVVSNDLEADDKLLIMITGANQGGKSTFLRSLGVAQLMLQTGMFVAAEAFSANVCDGLFTHYRREEDSSLKSGKFDEELRRMSGIVEQMTATPVILFNESFAATNEREGSEIARQIVAALIERGIKVIFVTHMYELARGFADQRLAHALFLRAERQENGKRTFKIIPAAPMPTSYGEDVYRQVFGQERCARDTEGSG